MREAALFFFFEVGNRADVDGAVRDGHVGRDRVRVGPDEDRGRRADAAGELQDPVGRAGVVFGIFGDDEVAAVEAVEVVQAAVLDARHSESRRHRRRRLARAGIGLIERIDRHRELHGRALREARDGVAVGLVEAEARVHLVVAVLGNGVRAISVEGRGVGERVEAPEVPRVVGAVGRVIRRVHEDVAARERRVERVGGIEPEDGLDVIVGADAIRVVRVARAHDEPHDRRARGERGFEPGQIRD
mmetsp:Transcript_4501/g.18331  ORF Transcript_4501/g.18331 Transcript_4501/m.18331 type:complete len:245 (+) Transcript_4501:1650-2384(+)